MELPEPTYISSGVVQVNESSMEFRRFRRTVQDDLSVAIGGHDQSEAIEIVTTLFNDYQISKT